MGVSQPYWDFGTKYNINSDEKTFPVIWVCYDGMVGGDVLACTTALFHVDTEQFSDAITVQYDIRDIFGLSGTSLRSSLLATLQRDPVEGPSLHEPLENELVNQMDDVSDNSSDDVTEQDFTGNESDSITDDSSDKDTPNDKSENSGEGLDPIDDSLSLD